MRESGYTVCVVVVVVDDTRRANLSGVQARRCLFGRLHVRHIEIAIRCGEYLNFVMATYNTSNLIIHADRSAARLPVCDVPVHHLVRLALLSHLATLHQALLIHSSNTKQCTRALTALTAASLPSSLRSSKLIISPHTNLFSKSELHTKYISTHTTFGCLHYKGTH